MINSLSVNGLTRSLADWTELSPVTADEIRLRLSAGYSPEDAVYRERRDPTPSDNPKKKHSKFFGVTWRERNQRWFARITHEGADHGLGMYKSEIEAAIAYNVAARKYHGGDATLNIA